MSFQLVKYRAVFTGLKGTKHVKTFRTREGAHNFAAFKANAMQRKTYVEKWTFAYTTAEGAPAWRMDEVYSVAPNERGSHNQLRLPL